MLTCNPPISSTDSSALVISLTRFLWSLPISVLLRITGLPFTTTISPSSFLAKASWAAKYSTMPGSFLTSSSVNTCAVLSPSLSGDILSRIALRAATNSSIAAFTLGLFVMPLPSLMNILLTPPSESKRTLKTFSKTYLIPESVFECSESIMWFKSLLFALPAPVMAPGPLP